MAVAVLGMGLSLQPTISVAGQGEDHIQEVIKHAKEGIAHTIEAIHHIEASIKGTGDAHAKEALQHANEAVTHAEQSIAHAEKAAKNPACCPEGKKESKYEAEDEDSAAGVFCYRQHYPDDEKVRQCHNCDA